MIYHLKSTKNFIKKESILLAPHFTMIDIKVLVIIIRFKKIKNDLLDLDLFVYGYVPECFIKTYSAK